ncbi:hypothetical protein PGT21_013080 [Puccinia graminis f. sp. tritici]|uniref:Uncharacterized protein n=1 Tax=Puccinia graminis f. sp. tritici TaxID=56615 RepID=A0A5B0Q2B7_PUCGR|nr:hypothetical protein PGT21_013080 [Puccinia graminis f. sp. tritici]
MYFLLTPFNGYSVSYHQRRSGYVASRLVSGPCSACDEGLVFVGSRFLKAHILSDFIIIIIISVSISTCFLLHIYSLCLARDFSLSNPSPTSVVSTPFFSFQSPTRDISAAPASPFRNLLLSAAIV